MKMSEEDLLYVNKSGEDTMITKLMLKTSQVYIGIFIFYGDMDKYIGIISIYLSIYILRYYVGYQMQTQ